MRTILTTTGTSLLTNAARELKKRPNQVSDQELTQYFKQFGASEASAETNSLLKIVTPEDEVVLLYTTTPEGDRCAKQVQKYLNNEGWKNLRLRQLPLEQNEAQFERHGLRELVDILIDEINQAQRQQKEVIINATGGFKAEIAYTTMVGMIFQIPVKYIYQGFQQPITFPALPVTWNIDLLLAYEDFFTWLDECQKEEAVENRLQAIPERNQLQAFLLPPDAEGYVFLSPAGEILWKRLKQQQDLADFVDDPPISTVPISQKISSSLREKKHHPIQGTLELAEKLAELDYVEEIIGGFWENTTNRRIKGITEDGLVRLLWADNTKATNLTIRTTARGQAQTLRVRDRYIRPVFDQLCKQK